ncbi:DNA primase [Phosphitispora sp. TUW77]|uniref:DNA primase n=1 Tax=Phosphitispora sp. TUW77 TaxID=3152361 RepID=UPI003AB19567
MKPSGRITDNFGEGFNYKIPEKGWFKLKGFIPEETIDEIRASNDIVNVVSDYVRIRKQGNNYVGLCPFHNEKTPSFMVSGDKQIFRCFGCGEGGNVISFIMKLEKLSFPEAVRFLANRAGITIPEEDDPVKSAKLKELKEAHEINELVKDFYRYILANHQIAGEARSYLKKRGLTEKTIDKFQIGFAPPSWDGLLRFLDKKGYAPEKLEKLGLVLHTSKGKPGFYDRFRNRVIFPIWDIRGKIVGFGGRVLDDGVPKYLNSPETIVFNKSHLLYGINKAAESIRRNDQAIIVEGYLDVITCHQAGIFNVVASLGTAFTREQGKLLLRYSQEVIMAYDADVAGVHATMRGWQLLDDLGCRVRVVSIPDGKDPDEFIRTHGADKFLDVVRQNAQSLSEFNTDRALEKYDMTTLEGKFKIASEVIPSIINISNEIEKNEAVMKLAKRLHLSPEAVRAEVGKKLRTSRNSWLNRDKITDARNNNDNRVSGQIVSGDEDARSKAEESLFVLMLSDKNIFLKVKEEIGIHFSLRLEYLRIINLLNEIVENELDYQPAVLFDRLQNEPAAEILKRLLLIEMPQDNRTQLIVDCIRTVKEDEIRKKREELLEKMEEADKSRDQELRKQLLLEYSKLI